MILNHKYFKDTPQPKKDFLPEKDGCGIGTLGLHIDFMKFEMQEFTLCCNDHDICYGITI